MYPVEPALTPKSLKQIGKIQIDDLAALLTVAETGSFRKAALRTGVQQSSITRRVQKLEEALGVSLLERNSSGARLTNGGQLFFEEACGFYSAFRRAIENAQCSGIGGRGILRIGLIASLSYGAFRKVVGSFRDQYPDVEVRLAEADRNLLLSALSHRTLDIVLAAGSQASGLGDTMVLSEEPIYLAVAMEHALSRRQDITWSDVEHETFIVSATEPGPEIQDYLLRRISKLGRRVKIRQHYLEREGIMNLVGLGFGVSLVAEHWCGVTYPNVVFRRIGDADERVPFSLIWRSENDNPALRRFLSLARMRAKMPPSASAPSQIPDPSP